MISFCLVAASGISFKCMETARREGNQTYDEIVGVSDIDRMLRGMACKIDRLATIAAIKSKTGGACRLLHAS